MSFTIHDLPVSERPRERLLKLGTEALSAQEILALEAVQQSKIARKRKVYSALNPKRRRKNGVKINCGAASLVLGRDIAGESVMVTAQRL
ncbi:DNA repair protein RadC, contains a helix-hairpin-helix DNA-binding motif [Candidatus Methanophagaceae archaeon]|jgi:hypothetical protein|nr:DNA repair protein RadC, contains a helix-hairpin-helix DNA-binding motif [Methanophagales archaeon]